MDSTSTASKCISNRVTELINKSIDMYNETNSGRTINKIEDNYSITDDTFKWNIGTVATPQNIEIKFGDIKGLCKNQIYLVDFLIHYAFSLVNECTVDMTKTCNIDGINTKIKNMITSLQKILPQKSNGSNTTRT